MSSQQPVERKKLDYSASSHLNIPDDITTSKPLPQLNKNKTTSESNAFSLCTFFIILSTTLFVIIIAVASLPLLLVSFIVTRLLQFIRHGDDYDRAVHFKLFIRGWICTIMVCLVVLLALLYGIPKINSTLRVVFMGSPLSNWIFAYFGIFLISWLGSVIIYMFVPILLPLNHSESGLNVPENVLEIFDCVLFLVVLYGVPSRVPSLEEDKIFRYTRKWLTASVSLVIAYNIIILATRFIVWLFKYADAKLHPGSNKKSRRYIFTEKIMHLRHLMYCANGLKHNIDFVLTSLMLLLIWVLYFGPHLNEYGTTWAKKLVQIGTWTCVSLLICAFLWFIKTCLILSWEARAVYNRLETKIVDGAKQLYFLGVIGRRIHDIFNIQYEITRHPEKELFMFFSVNFFPIGVINIDSRYQSDSDVIDELVRDEKEDDRSIKLSRKRKKIVNADLFMKKDRRPTMFGLQQAAHYFLKARETLENEKYTSDIMDELKSRINSSEQQVSKNENIEKKDLMQLIEAGDQSKRNDSESKRNGIWAYFEDQIREYVAIPNEEISPEEISTEEITPEEISPEDISTEEITPEEISPEEISAEEISLEAIEKWMERARNHCLFLANTLASAKEVVDCLNKIISWLLIAITFILWLLLTGFATTQVLVLIASPLLAATFIFGDSCKTLFQGIIFAYVVHPFDVGDLCVIDGDMMEVKTISVWITTFSKVGSREEVIYPNSELSSKSKIINHKTSFDWNDHIEVNVKSLDERKITNLQKDIEKYLDEKDKFTPGYNSVVALRIGDDSKIDISFRHNVNPKNRTYFQCQKQKHKLRSKYVNYFHKEKTKIEETSERIFPTQMINDISAAS